MSRTRRRRTTRDRNDRVIALPGFEEGIRNPGIGRMLTGLGLAQAHLESLAAAEHANQAIESEADASEPEEDAHA